MNILFILPMPFFRERGSPMRALPQLMELGATGHSVDLLCYPFGNDLAIPNVRLVRSPKVPGVDDVKVGPSLAKIPLDAMMFLKAVQMCRQKRYDVIQAVEEAAFMAALLKKLFGRKLVYNMDSHLSDQLRYSGFFKATLLLQLAEAAEQAVMRYADLAVTVGPVLSDFVREAAPDVDILELHDAPLTDFFVEDATRACQLRAELGLKESDRIALYTGNFSGYQGVDLLIRAAGVLAARNAVIKMVIVGGEAAEAEQMQALAETCGAGSVCIFAGKRPAGDIPAFITLAEVLLSPRILGTNPPLKIYTYLQSGRVIVATNISTHTQVVDERCAILAEPTPEGFAEAVMKALAEPELATALAAEARQRVEERYSMKMFRQKVRTAFARLSQAS